MITNLRSDPGSAVAAKRKAAVFLWPSVWNHPFIHSSRPVFHSFSTAFPHVSTVFPQLYPQASQRCRYACRDGTLPSAPRATACVGTALCRPPPARAGRHSAVRPRHARDGTLPSAPRHSLCRDGTLPSAPGTRGTARCRPSFGAKNIMKTENLRLKNEK